MEERVVMPALAQAFTVPDLLGVHQRILGGISPDDMAWSLAKMLPAMNVEDRAELLAGTRASAPPEAFAGVCALAAEVLPAADVDAVHARLDAWVPANG